eukprot:Gb_25431 [translate_table: standard]
MAVKKGGKDKRGKKEDAANVEIGTNQLSTKELQARLAAAEEEKAKESEERNYTQLERDKIAAFWEIKKKDYEHLKAELLIKDRNIEELQQRHQDEIKRHKQVCCNKTSLVEMTGALLRHFFMDIIASYGFLIHSLTAEEDKSDHSLENLKDQATSAGYFEKSYMYHAGRESLLCFVIHTTFCDVNALISFRPFFIKFESSGHVYNQKMKHLLYEQQNIIATLKSEHELTAIMQREQAAKREAELLNDNRCLKQKLKELELSYEDTLRQLKLDHAKDTTKMKHELDLSSRELYFKTEEKIKVVREEAEARRKQEIHEIEERKNTHINELMKKHEKAFTEIKCYYNDITHNNLDLIKTLKEDVADMKKKEGANEKLMYEIAQENKRLTEPLTKALKEVENLRKQLEKSDKLQTERDELRAKFESSVFEVKQKCDLKNLLLEKKVQALTGLSNDENTQGELEKFVDAKNMEIKSLRFNLAKTTKVCTGYLALSDMALSQAYNDVIKAFEIKLVEYGIPLEEMGLLHYISTA